MWSNTFKLPTVVELVHPNYTNPCCWLLGNALGANYGFVVCEHTGIEDMICDPEEVRDVIVDVEKKAKGRF